MGGIKVNADQIKNFQDTLVLAQLAFALVRGAAAALRAAGAKVDDDATLISGLAADSADGKANAQAVGDNLRAQAGL
jgi:hypothetical protein